MISIYQLKPRFQALLWPYANKLHARGITANQVTLSTMVVSILIGCYLYAFHQYNWSHWNFIILPIWLFLRMALNAIDGMIAREYHQQTSLGTYYNELSDAISDCALYLPFAGLMGVYAPLVIIICLFSVLTEYVGVIGVMVGNCRRYDGPMGKSDRALLLGFIGLGVGCHFLNSVWVNGLLGLTLVLLIVTLINRIYRGIKISA